MVFREHGSQDPLINVGVRSGGSFRQLILKGKSVLYTFARRRAGAYGHSGHDGEGRNPSASDGN